MYAIGIGTIGVGIGLILIATKYMVFFFPGREGTFAALGRGIGYCFMYGWYYLAEYIINPEGKEQDAVTKYYARTIAENTRKYLMTIIIGTIISTVIFLLLTIRINFNNVKKEANKSKENKVDLIQNKSNEPSKDRYKEDLKIAFTS